MRRTLVFAATLFLIGCGDSPVEPELLSLEPAFDLHASATAGDLDDPNGAYDEVAANTFQRHTAGTRDGDRFYMRTVATDFNEKDFTAELVFSLTNLSTDGATIHFFGIGDGVPVDGNNEPAGAFFRIHSPDVPAGMHVTTRNANGSLFAVQQSFPNITVSGLTHRAFITKAGNALTFAVDVNDDGTVEHTYVIPDYTLLTDIGSTNSRIYFGTSTQDTFSLSIDSDSNDPTTKAECKKGGWEDFGFRNQGQCIRFVNTGKDSR